MVAIQEAPMKIQPGAQVKAGFFGWFEENHSAATSSSDLVFIDKAMSLPEAAASTGIESAHGSKPAATLFSAAPLLEAQELTDAEIADLFGRERRAEEQEDGKRLSSYRREPARGAEGQGAEGPAAPTARSFAPATP